MACLDLAEGYPFSHRRLELRNAPKPPELTCQLLDKLFLDLRFGMDFSEKLVAHLLEIARVLAPMSRPLPTVRASPHCDY